MKAAGHVHNWVNVGEGKGVRYEMCPKCGERRTVK